MSPEAIECHGYFIEAVSSASGDGRKRVIFDIARSTGMSERRVVGIMRAEVKRIWADEIRSVRDWHQTWRRKQVAILRHKAALLEAAEDAALRDIS